MEVERAIGDVNWTFEKLEEKKINTNWDTDFVIRDGLRFPRYEYNVDLHFSCRTTLANWAHKNNESRLLSIEQEGALLENFIHVDHKNVFFSDETYEVIKRSINGWSWPISEGVSKSIAKDVMEKMGEILDSITAPGLYWLKAAIEIENEENIIYHEEDDPEVADEDEVNDWQEDLMMADDDWQEDLMISDDDWQEEEDLMVTLQQSINESVPEMIPASDSSIESLKSKVFICESKDCESCSICLDEFANGCEIMPMPCKHHFHNHCLTEWLRTSHYCPNCRYELA